MHTKVINQIKNIILLQMIIKCLFGASGYSDFTIHKDGERKLRYIKRHNNENWTKSGINSAGFWSRWLLWNLPTISASYQDIKKRFNI